MKENRKPIPESIKRKVRRSCGFGCVICGVPIYDIDHITEYSKVKKHTEDNLVLLCPTHHREKKWMPVEELRKHKRNPINLRTGTSHPHFFTMTGDEIHIYLGQNQYSKTFSSDRNFNFPIVIENEPLISLKKAENLLLLSMTIHDEHNKPVLVIEDSEIMFSTGVWDISIIGTRLTLISSKKRKLIELKFDIEDSVLRFLYANFQFRSWDIKIAADGYFSFTHPTKGSRKLIGLTVGGNPRMESTITIRNEEQPVDVGFMIGDCPQFEKHSYLFRSR